MFYVLVCVEFPVGYYDSDDIPGIGQYEDFHTIDWQRDIARDRMRHRYIVKKRQVSSGINDGSSFGNGKQRSIK